MPQLLKKQSAILLFIMLGIFYNVHAQTNKNDSTDTGKSYFKANLNYLSNAVYYGRKDSLITPYVTPSIGYYNKSGLYVNGSLSYLASSERRIDLFTIEAGYDFTFKNNFSGGIYADKYFYNQSSTNVQSDIKGLAGANLGYDFGVLQLNVTADLMFANKTDFSLNGSIAHAFYIGEEAKQWTVTPTVTANMSTLNFYEGYTNRRAGKNAQNANGATITTVTTITNRGTGLTLLDYEFSVPLSYDAEKWGFSFSPTLAFPQTPIYTSTTTTFTPRIGNPISQTRNSTPESERTLNTVFYAELGVYLKF